MNRRLAVQELRQQQDAHDDIPQPATIGELQALLDQFTAYYNTRRPLRSLPHRQTPAAAYAARPKAVPGDRAADTHDRIRADTIGKTGTVTFRHGGRLYHIGVGRTHAPNPPRTEMTPNPYVGSRSFLCPERGHGAPLGNRTCAKPLMEAVQHMTVGHPRRCRAPSRS